MCRVVRQGRDSGTLGNLEKWLLTHQYREAHILLFLTTGASSLKHSSSAYNAPRNGNQGRSSLKSSISSLCLEDFWLCVARGNRVLPWNIVPVVPSYRRVISKHSEDTELRFNQLPEQADGRPGLCLLLIALCLRSVCMCGRIWSEACFHYNLDMSL